MQNGSAFPVAHVLLKDKRFASYVAVLNAIQRYATERGLGDVFCRGSLKITVDYENALIKAFNHMGANVHGCHFHLCQAIWRFVHTHGLAPTYNANADFRNSVRSLMALVFLKSSDIHRRFLGLRGTVDSDSLMLVYDYFERTWINGFGTGLISQHDELVRTNNNAEAFHNSLRHVFFANHPQFNEFVEKTVNIMETAEADYEAERLRPKELDRRRLSSFKNIKCVVDNFYSDSVLGLPLKGLLWGIGKSPMKTLVLNCTSGATKPCLILSGRVSTDGVPMTMDNARQ